jgi:hypothetical protein
MVMGFRRKALVDLLRAIAFSTEKVLSWPGAGRSRACGGFEW